MRNRNFGNRKLLRLLLLLLSALQRKADQMILYLLRTVQVIDTPEVLASKMSYNVLFYSSCQCWWGLSYFIYYRGGGRHEFCNDMFSTYLTVIATGISAGFVLGFISWGIGYAIYSIIKFFKMA